MKKFMLIAVVFMFVCGMLAGCGSAPQESLSQPAASIHSSSEVVVSSSAVASSASNNSTINTIEYNGLSFDLDSKYGMEEENDELSITFAPGVSTLWVTFAKTILTDRDVEASLYNAAFFSEMQEKQNQNQGDVDINGVVSKMTTCNTKTDNSSWVNVAVLTVPTGTGYVNFFFLHSLESETDYIDIFDELVKSIQVA